MIKGKKIIHDSKINAMKNCPMCHRIIFIHTAQKFRFIDLETKHKLFGPEDHKLNIFYNKWRRAYCFKANKRKRQDGQVAAAW